MPIFTHPNTVTTTPQQHHAKKNPNQTQRKNHYTKPSKVTKKKTKPITQSKTDSKISAKTGMDRGHPKKLT